MSKIALSADQKQALGQFFLNLRGLAVTSPGAYPDALGMIIADLCTGNISLANYTTGTLPATGALGDLVYNTTTAAINYWNGTAWAAISGSSTGNVTFSGNNVGLSGAGALGLGVSSATSVSFLSATLSMLGNTIITGASSATNTTAFKTTTSVADGATSIANQYTNTADIISGGFLAQWTSGTQNAFAVQRVGTGILTSTWLWGPGLSTVIGSNSGLRLSDNAGTILKYGTNSVEVNTDVVGVSFHVGGTNIMSVIAGVLEPAADLGLALGGAANRWTSLYTPSINCGPSSNLTLNAPSGQNIYFAPGGANYFSMSAALFNPINDLQCSLGTSSTHWTSTWSNLYASIVGAAITAAATISPTAGIHSLTGVTPITTINLPVTGFVGTITFLPTAAAIFSTGGNIHAALTAVAGVPILATYDGTAWWLK